jgi:hypothetical protein
MKKNRLRRDDPLRTEPIRDWEQLFRKPGTADSVQPENVNGSEEAPNESDANDHSWDDAVSNAVDMGYRIIEDQITQGKRIAEEISERTNPTPSVGGDVSDFVRRLLQFYTDLGTTCFDFVDSLTRNAEFSKNLSELVDDGISSAGNHKARDESQEATRHNIPIDVVSMQPARVSLELHDNVALDSISVRGLFDLDPSVSPLTDVAFTNSEEDQGPVLNIRVPPDQPAGTYTGVVTDSKTNQPRGTLSVKISQDVKGRN